MLERALNPTRDEILTVAAVSIAGLIALIGLLAILHASTTPSVGTGAYNAEAGDAPVPSFVAEPDAMGQNEKDRTEGRSSGAGESSVISAVFPEIGELVNFGGEGPSSGPNAQTFSGPQPSPDPSVTRTPSSSPDPSPTPETSPSSEPSPEPSEEPEPSPEPTDEPEPPPPGCVPPPHC